MKVISAEMMREIDNSTIEGRGIPGHDLMEAAGSGVADKITDLLGDTRGANVSIFCGKGNNGGDGFVVARLLSEEDVIVKIFLLTDPKKLKGDALINFGKLPDKVTVFQITGRDDLTEIAEQLPKENLIVDALLGTGITGPVSDEYARIIDLINTSGAHVVSVDIPSGVEGSTGKIGNVAVKADHTVTMAIPKLGLFLQPGSECSGEISIVDIGVPDDILEEFDFKYDVLDNEIAKELLPPRSQVSHKGNYGRIVIIGGSRGVGGAIALACDAALRSGAGMVVAASPKSIQKELAIKLTETMTEPLAENSEGTLTPDSIEQLKPALDWADVVAIGPGIGTTDTVIEFFERFLDICDHPLVIDADGVRCMQKFRDKLKKRKTPVVITPHPSELAHFLEKESTDILDNYFEAAITTAQEYEIATHLKVHRSVSAHPDGRATINVTGNSGMATAGSGDVLTGIIVGFLAQGADVYDAARLGAYLHGLAGDIGARELGEYSLMSGDLIRYLPKAIMHVLTGE